MKKAMAMFAAAAGMLVAGQRAGAEPIGPLVEQYKAAGTAVVDMVNSKSVNVAAVEARVLELTKASVALAKAYETAHPEGAKLLETVIGQVAVVENGAVTKIGPMSDLSFDEIETQWHDLGYFESHDVGLDVTDEDNEHFTDPLHTMIHPIMVLRAARDYEASKSDDDLNNMKSEMEEGMEQAVLLAEALE